LIKYLIDFPSRASYAVSVGVVGIVVHLLAQNPGEVVVHRIGERREGGTPIRLDKSAVDISKERERDPS
jgi:hypothetical protein